MAAGKTLTVFLAADLKNFNRNINSAQKSVKGFGGSIDSFLKPALIGAAAAAGVFAVKIAGDAIKAARDLGETQNKVSVIFGESSRSILQFSQTAVTSLGQTQEQALSAAATFAQFGKAAGLAGTDLVGFSTELVTLSADLASFNNSTPEQAITAIGAALRGEAEPLRNFGVLLDDATLRARAMEMGIYDGSGALTQQQKVLAAHQEILSQTTDAQGDFSRTSEGLANTQRILQAAVEDAKAEIGIGLVDALESASQAMGGSKGMAKLISDGGEVVGDLTRGVGILASELIKLTKGLTNNGDAAKEAEEGQNLVRDAVKLYFAQIGLVVPALGIFSNALLEHATASRIAGEETSFLIGQIAALRKAQTSGIFAEQEAAYQLRVTTEAEEAATDATKKNTTAKGSNTQATDMLTKAEEKLEAQYDNRLTKMTNTAKALDTEIGKLHDARKAVDDYVAATSQTLNTIDLASIFGGAVGADGKLVAGDFVNSFNTAVDQAPWFGNVLNALKQRGVDQTLVEELASLGPEIGGGIGQAMLDDPGGLLSTLNTKWVTVQETFKTLAMGLVPDALLAGEAAAVATIDGLSAQLVKDTGRLNKLGKNIGKAVGVTFKAQLLSDIAEAIREVEATATAARAEKVASAARQQVAITNTQIAQAVQNTLVTADARNGLPSRPIFT
jgi:hypothetical protein